MGDYDWAPAIAMMAVYFIFFAEIAAYRAGTARLEKLGMAGYGESVLVLAQAWSERL